MLSTFTSSGFEVPNQTVPSFLLSPRPDLPGEKGKEEMRTGMRVKRWFDKELIRRLLMPAIPLVRPLVFSMLPDGNPVKRTFIEKTFHKVARSANAAYFLYNDSGPDALKNFNPQLIARAVDFDYLSWPRRIRNHVRGKDILDVGCGTGLHAMGYVVVGVKTYTGLDPKIKLDSDRAKNIPKRRWEPFGWTPREMMEALPKVTLIPGTFEIMAPDQSFDVVVLHNTTEHLLNLEEVLQGVTERLRPDGQILYNHHNFYCWNGHHLAPKFVDDIDPADPEQRKYVDWAHLSFDPPPDHYISRGLNRIRLDELRELTQCYFDIRVWEERPSTEKNGRRRLTPEILARCPQYSERELTTQNVFCIADRKAARSRKPSAERSKVKPRSGPVRR